MIDYSLDEMTGEIRMNGRIREGEYTFQVRVYDIVHQREVVSSVTVIFKDISDDALFNSGSIRISGMYTFSLFIHCCLMKMT